MSKPLIRCPKCHKENYILNAWTGICTWCGYDNNKREEQDHERNEKLGPNDKTVQPE